MMDVCDGQLLLPRTAASSYATVRGGAGAPRFTRRTPGVRPGVPFGVGVS